MEDNQPRNASEQSIDEKNSDGQIPDIFLPLRQFIASKSPKNSNLKLLLTLALFVLSALLFSFVLQADFSAMQKAMLSLVLFMLCGESARAIMSWDGFYGLIIFRNKSTLAWIDRQAKKYQDVWIALCDVGLVLGYGLSSWLMISKEQKKERVRVLTMYFGGLLILFLFSSIVSSMALPVISSMLFKATESTSATGQMNDMMQDYKQIQIDLEPIVGIDMSINIITILVFLVVIIFGLAGSVYFSLLMYAVFALPKILMSIISFVASLVGMGEFDASTVPQPGGSPILPGINLPLVEGILALASVLIVHEMSHGLMARIANVRLDSAGLVFFGILPFGAFVEPDENEMNKIKKYEENRIIVAGSASNIMLSIISFFLMTSIVFLTYDLRLDGYMVTSGNLPQGVIVQSIDGTQYMGQKIDIVPNKQVEIITDEGTFSRTTDENGKIGIGMNWVDKSAFAFSFKYVKDYRWIEFLLNTLGLVFAINMFVGMINLLPLPLFDGNKLMLNAIGDTKLAFVISAICAGSFIVTMLPWIFK